MAGGQDLFWWLGLTKSKMSVARNQKRSLLTFPARPPARRGCQCQLLVWCTSCSLSGLELGRTISSRRCNNSPHDGAPHYPQPLRHSTPAPRRRFRRRNHPNRQEGHPGKLGTSKFAPPYSAWCSSPSASRRWSLRLAGRGLSAPQGPPTRVDWQGRQWEDAPME